MANRVTNTANAYETILTASMGSEDLVATVEARAGAPTAPCILVIDPLDSDKREYIFFDASSTGTSFTTSTTDNRYLTGSAASGGITHDAGAIVRMSPLAQHIQDLNDRIDSRLAASQHTAAVHNAMSLSHASLSNLGTGDPHTQYLTSDRHLSADHSAYVLGTPSGRKLHVGTTAPGSPAVNDLWVDTN
jgi:hypothetical protein